MSDIGVVANSGLNPLSSESWTQRSEDVYSILAGSYVVSVHKPRERMKFVIDVNPSGNRTLTKFDVDASLLVKRLEPTPAFLPRQPEPDYRPVLDAQFQDGRFLFVTDYRPPYSGQRITNIADLRNYFTVEIEPHSLGIFHRLGLPESYRNAVSGMLH